jgi:hypothetical protein
MSDPRDDLAALAREFYVRSRRLFGDTGTNPVGWQRLATVILAAGYRKPKPPTVTPPHDIDVERAPYCTVCGRDVQYNDNTEQWEH